MRRFLILLLLLTLAFVGCSERFATAEGGYLDEKTGKIYKPLSEAFEAIAGGEEVGEWESTLYEDTLTFLEIPLADGTRMTVTDYASAGKLWRQASRMAVWMLGK